jgi:hypothetical protein
MKTEQRTVPGPGAPTHLQGPGPTGVVPGSMSHPPTTPPYADHVHSQHAANFSRFLEFGENND